MPVPWEYYAKRHDTNVEEFIHKNECKSYEDFCASLNCGDVSPPSKKEVDLCLSGIRELEAAAKPRPRPTAKKVALGTASASPSPSRHAIRKAKAKRTKTEKKPEKKSE